jgi:hypothetical protein
MDSKMLLPDCKKKKDIGDISYLNIPNQKNNNESLLEALNSMEDNSITMHPKLKLIMEFLKADKLHIDERFGPPWRKSFLEYLSSLNPGNRLACVIGQ